MNLFDTAQVAFGKIGDLLQDRRKRDLYEMVQYHASSQTDPARDDESLKSQLEANKKFYNKRMDDVIERYVTAMCANLNFDRDN